MNRSREAQSLVAAFPTDRSSLTLVFRRPLTPPELAKLSVRLASGLAIRRVGVDPTDARRVRVATAAMRSAPLTIDTITVRIPGVTIPPDERSVRFAHGVLSPVELRVPNMEPDFPYRSTLVGVHVSVACCTGCNGGVHDRDLVVLNHHVGGPWTGVWVQTPKTIEAPYPRWQKITCAGGVVAEVGGSTTVVDEGWMVIEKQFEVPHHAPPPLPVAAADLSHGRDRSILGKGLDAAWVEFRDVVIDEARTVEPKRVASGRTRLVRNEVAFTDRSGGRMTAWLYQPSGLGLRRGDRAAFLRGFVHAERPGVYVVLGDKEEDLGRAPSD